MLVTLLPIVTEVRLEQYRKTLLNDTQHASLSITTKVKAEQPSKAKFAMLVTPLPIEAEVKAEQPMYLQVGLYQ